MLFLSHAAEDTELAEAIVRWLEANAQVTVRLWRTSEPRPPIRGAEELISQAEGYLALLSPDFLSAPLCRRERELAVCREQGLRMRYPAVQFVHVLLARDTDEPADGFPPRDEWLDVTRPGRLESALRQLVPRLTSVVSAAGPAAITPGRGSIFFRNRTEELELVVRNLTNFGGPHFWLVIAPPQLGKTWFLDQLGATLLLSQQEPWVVKLVDVREQKAEVRTEFGALLKCLFGADSPTAPERETYVRIAQSIIKSRRRHLCMIDGAELLTEDTARALRACLSEIHNMVGDAGLAQARFAAVVASRRDKEWRGITPGPRFTILPLTEFNPDVVQDALTTLTEEMDRNFDRAVLARHAGRVYRLSEGLPALLTRCIAWIRHQDWVDMERLESEQVFRELAQPYIEDGLLARESLFPLSHAQTDPAAAEAAPTVAFEHALRVLAPYRLFTQSHLRHYRVMDARLSASMDGLGWTVEDLWRALSSSALLTRPLDEPWQEIPGGIRRLLFRYYYLGRSQRAEAHSDARSFTAVWADEQPGKEQIVGLVECLWHEAAALRLERSPVFEPVLQSARVLSRGLRGSSAYTKDELREFAAERISGDEEFQETVGDHAIVSRIIAAILAP